MAKRRGTPARGSRSGGGGDAGKLVAGFVAGAAVAVGGVYLYQHTGGHLPGSATEAPVRSGVDPGMTASEVPGGSAANQAATRGAGGAAAAPAPAKTAPAAGWVGGSGVPASADGAKTPTAVAGVPRAPFGADEEVFEAGARVYRAQCASCHGRPGQGAGPGAGSTTAGQFWSKGGSAAKAVAGQAPGVTYTQVAKGNPEHGMPAYAGVLSERELWDVSLLLKSAGSELPDPVVTILRWK